MNAPINKIIDQTLVDGPGNRTAIFFQQCNLACLYCHNPETQQMCRQCGHCQEVCPTGALRLTNYNVVWDKQLCISCDSCIKGCTSCSSPKITEMTVEEVLKAIVRNLPFIRGITVSGGECALYLPFIRQLFTKCQNLGLSCLIDSNGTIPLWDDEVMKVCDGVMLDVKAWDDDKFFKLTNGHNNIVKENLDKLAQMDKLQELRVVCFEDEEWADAEEVIKKIALHATEQVRQHTLLKLIRFRNNGVIGAFRQIAQPSSARMEQLMQLAVECGFERIKVV